MGFRLLLILLLLLAPVRAGYGSENLEKVKAIYLAKILSFAKVWPRKPYGLAPNIRMCFVAQSEMVETFQKVTRASTSFGIKTVMIDEGDVKLELKCDAIYIAANHHHAKEILAGLQGKNILTISEEEMIWEGAIISFYRLGDKLKFYLNFQNMKDSDFEFSINFIEISHIVNYWESESYNRDFER